MGLDTVEFVLWAEKHFGMTIADADAEKLETVGEFCRYVAEHCPVPHAYDEVFLVVKMHLHQENAIPLAQIQERSAFVRDLGLD